MNFILLGNPSVLLAPRIKSKELLDKFSWDDILKELKQRASTLLDVLITVALPLKRNATASEVPALCMAYSVLMNQRWKELSLLQKLNTVTLGVGHATKKVKLFYCTELWHFDQIFLLILGDTLQQLNYTFCCPEKIFRPCNWVV